jgi:hypothetical protein
VIILRKGGGTVEVHFAQTNPEEAYSGSLTVTLLQPSPDGSEWYQQTASATNARDRTLTLNTAPPGDYLLFAWPMPNEIEYLNPQVLAQYRSLATADRQEDRL